MGTLPPWSPHSELELLGNGLRAVIAALNL